MTSNLQTPILLSMRLQITKQPNEEDGVPQYLHRLGEAIHT